MSPGRADRLLDAVAIGRGGRALDVGCGKGEFLLRLAERHGWSGIGIDTNAAFLAEARAAQALRRPGAALEWRELDAREFRAAPGSFDAALCLGATHALGGYAAALKALKRWVRPGGRLLVGEGCWRREPDPDYLAFLGATRDECTDHAETVARGEHHGLIARAAETSSLEEWDDYEDRYAAAVERFAADHPEDPDAGAMVERIRAWRDAYRCWGRETLGFGWYLFEVPEARAGT